MNNLLQKPNCSKLYLKRMSKNSKSSTTPSLKAIAGLGTDSLIASYVRPPSIRRLWVFPHLH
jgi:hypothetical protein